MRWGQAVEQTSNGHWRSCGGDGGFLQGPGLTDAAFVDPAMPVLQKGKNEALAIWKCAAGEFDHGVDVLVGHFERGRKAFAVVCMRENCFCKNAKREKFP